ncbi:MAG TPA: PfkB family carbohydrate kinase, partial [Longimicrobiales bacterium]|nr:PfkB family carbohydrate kinase [Longimicrobiales bacterium]
MPPDRPEVCVFAPALYTTVTIEAGGDDFDEIHLHPGGQGFWVARMIRELGRRPLLCGPVGGETGRVIRGLVPEWGIDLSPVRIEANSPTYVHDRRGGERVEVARSPAPVLDRHEVDDLYGKVMQHSVGAGVCVLTGRASEEAFPVDLFRRLGADLGQAGVTLVADLHGEELEALLGGG